MEPGIQTLLVLNPEYLPGRKARQMFRDKIQWIEMQHNLNLGLCAHLTGMESVLEIEAMEHLMNAC